MIEWDYRQPPGWFGSLDREQRNIILALYRIKAERAEQLRKER